MDDEVRYILRKFSKYYERASFPIPEIERREFGAGIDKKIDSRHMGFDNETEFRAFLVNNTPLYVSHSVAYYNLPKATPMERKGWLGADLVFDLDFETESKYLSRPDFEKVREDTVRLVEEFLVPDFGVNPEMMSANFSGNRGFHVHVRDPRFKSLRGDERREIIEYIKGIGLKYDAFFSEKEAGASPGSGRPVYKEEGPQPAPSGYGGRFARKIVQLLESEPEKLSRIFKDTTKRDNFINGINSGNWSLRRLSPGIDAKLRAIAETELPMRTVNIDGGVTQDPSKLIRVANSIHGSTGLSAKMLKLSELASFEPMRGAIIFSETPVKITAIEDVPEIEMGGQTYDSMPKGTQKEVPEYLAFYLKLKGSVKLHLEQKPKA